MAESDLTDSEKTFFEVGSYLVCVIDLLGQQVDLGTYSDIITDASKIPPELQTYININSRNMLKLQKNLRNIHGNITKEAQRSYSEKPISGRMSFVQYADCLSKMKIKVQQGSDTYLLFMKIPSVEDDAEILCERIVIILFYLAMVFIQIPSAAMFVRGAITIGPAWELDDHTPNLYGPALATAVQLEKEAKFPRILIPKGVVNFLQSIHANTNGSVYNPCHMIKLDKDGEYSLHYLSERVITPLRLLPNYGEWKKSIEQGLTNIQQEYRKHSQSGTPEGQKIAEKYRYLRGYFEENRHCWDKDPVVLKRIAEN